MDFAQLHWLNFDGAPLLLLPNAARHKWLGLMSPYDEEVNAGVSPFDIAEINGGMYYLNDHMDFDHPQTDYDRICHVLQQQNRTHFTQKLDGETDCLVIGSFGDCFAWWEEEKIVFNDEHDLDVKMANWVDPVEFMVGESEMLFMNSAVYGADPALFEDDRYHQLITLAKGRYKIEKAEGDLVRVFRFTLLD